MDDLPCEIASDYKSDIISLLCDILSRRATEIWDGACGARPIPKFLAISTAISRESK